MQILRLRQAAVLAVTVCAGMAFSSAALAGDTPAALDRAPQTNAMRSSVITVDTLIADENRQALARSASTSVAAGLAETPKPAAPSGPPPGRIFVQSIFGIGDELRANIGFNGESYERVRAGARVGSCVIAKIADRAVVLKPASRGVPAAACPTGKWTGISPFPVNLDAARDLVKAGGSAALASPGIPTPYSSLGAPSLPLKASPRATGQASGPFPLPADAGLAQQPAATN
ncbi:hypothetical protein [Variovorax sp. RA8]|uniref:hypothetical protein n=1 Tax=Variovorax sp. (strain JCM 16519 / RA8) TaxID=662548 RepID=UPI00131758D3|nr:hypothetical protein [Variovorax sp. RA8]VTU44940.1 hypothetical protein RA8P2_00376 [Variovorax sp. RA8]